MLTNAKLISEAAEEYYSIMLDTWEDNIIWDDEGSSK